MLTYDFYNQVRDFHLKNGIVAPAQELGLLPEVSILRQRLILEELGEVSIALNKLPEAYQRAQLDDLADGLADLAYVIYGTMVSVGIPLPDVSLPFEAGDHSLYERSYQLATLAARIGELVWEIDDGCRNDCPEELSLRSAAALERVTRMAAIFNIPFRECFLEVCRSNLTKDARGKSPGDKGADTNPNYRGPYYEPPNLLQFLESSHG